MKPSKKAFTLVELLVVVAILGLLLGIMLPALAKAREQARNVICQTNLKNYGHGLALYLNDNDLRFPNAHRWLHNGSTFDEIRSRMFQGKE